MLQARTNRGLLRWRLEGYTRTKLVRDLWWRSAVSMLHSRQLWWQPACAARQQLLSAWHAGVAPVPPSALVLLRGAGGSPTPVGVRMVVRRCLWTDRGVLATPSLPPCGLAREGVAHAAATNEAAGDASNSVLHAPARYTARAHATQQRMADARADGRRQFRTLQRMAAVLQRRSTLVAERACSAAAATGSGTSSGSTCDAGALPVEAAAADALAVVGVYVRWRAATLFRRHQHLHPLCARARRQRAVARRSVRQLQQVVRNGERARVWHRLLQLAFGERGRVRHLLARVRYRQDRGASLRRSRNKCSEQEQRVAQPQPQQAHGCRGNNGVRRFAHVHVFTAAAAAAIDAMDAWPPLRTVSAAAAPPPFLCVSVRAMHCCMPRWLSACTIPVL